MRTWLVVSSCAVMGIAGCGGAPGDPGEGFVPPPDLALAGDLASTGCSPPCSGLTPLCNAARKCVACLADADCPQGSTCKVVSESVASCVPGCSDDKRCGNLRCCGSRCVDVASDAMNCGACGAVCSGTHARAACSGGKCSPGACDSGWGDCNKDPRDGCETNLHVDAAHCTACGNVCKIANAIAACADGCYAAACQWGFDDCNNDAMDGCETSVLMDGLNCGACGKSCAKLPNAMAGCMNGSCVLGKCSPGFENCDGDGKNGCEAQLVADPKNCGGCGKACPVNLPHCASGTCAAAPQCMRIGWKQGMADWSCPQGYRMPTINEWDAVAPCVIMADLVKLGMMNDVAISVGGCNCKWNNAWCGQPSIETIRQGRMCGDFEQLHICIR